jgi:hypothetical protein
MIRMHLFGESCARFGIYDCNLLGMLAFQAGIEPVEYTVQFRDASPNPYAAHFRDYEGEPLRPVKRGGLAGTEAVKHDKRGQAYFARRSKSTVKLVQAVTRDIQLFSEAYAIALGTSEAKVARASLAAHATAEVVPQVLIGSGEKASLKHAVTKIKYNPTSLSYMVLARWHASRDSIAAYVTVAKTLKATELATAIVLPGPVKGVCICPVNVLFFDPFMHFVWLEVEH